MINITNKEAMYPPVYLEDYQYYNNNNLYNCYAYALQLRITMDSLKEYGPYYIFNPGTITTKEVVDEYNSKLLLEGLKKDLEYLKINYSFEDLTRGEKEYLIAVYLSKYKFYYRGSYIRDYHFLRQNKDKTWSGKLGRYGRVVNYGNGIEVRDYELLRLVKLRKE